MTLFSMAETAPAGLQTIADRLAGLVGHTDRVRLSPMGTGELDNFHLFNSLVMIVMMTVSIMISIIVVILIVAVLIKAGMVATQHTETDLRCCGRRRICSGCGRRRCRSS